MDMGDASRFSRAVAAFDEANSADPNQEEVDGRAVPHEWVDAQRVSAWVFRLEPQASEVLRLASRCQHICRWKRPRDQYPQTRAGYLKWRQDLKRFHAETAGEILREVGYEEGVVEAVQALNLKKSLSAGGEVQVLEDALCLTFLQYEFGTFRKTVSEERMIGILQKTWKKMSAQAREEALGLDLDPEALELVKKALA